MDKGKFAVYRTVEVNVVDIIDRLGKGITGSQLTTPNAYPQYSQDIDYHTNLAQKKNTKTCGMRSPNHSSARYRHN